MASRNHSRSAQPDDARIHLTRTTKRGVDEQYVATEALAVGLEFDGYVRDKTSEAAPAPADPS